MGWLLADVARDRFQVGVADRKGPVAHLPGEAIHAEASRDERGGGDFQFAHEIAHGEGGTQADEQVDMIVDATNR